MTLSVLAAPGNEPGTVRILEKQDGMVLREVVLAAEQGQQLGFDLCRLSTEILKRERTT